MSDVAELGLSCAEKPRLAGRGRAAVARTGSAPRPVRIVVIGEFNSGKTTLINALLGAAVLPASFITHTTHPTVVRFAAKPTLSAEVAGRRRVAFAWEDLDAASSRHIHRLHIGMPLNRLKTLQMTDTPGLGLGDPVSEERAIRACRGADIVLWCTPAMQAWKASEVQVWLAMPRWLRRRGVLAVTFMDALNTHADAAKVMARLHADAGDMFGRIISTAAHGVDRMLGASSDEMSG